MIKAAITRQDGSRREHEFHTLEELVAFVKRLPDVMKVCIYIKPKGESK